MTFTALRALHAIIGEALEQIESVYAGHASQDDSITTSNSPPSNNASIGHHPHQHQPSPPPPPKPLHHRATLSVTSLSKIYASPPPSPCIKTEHTASPSLSSEALLSSPPPLPQIDFPSLDTPCDLTSPSETLTQHPDVISASNRIIAACGQMAVTLQTPYMTLSDVTMQVRAVLFSTCIQK